jgi:RNA polymerase sigma-70 factor, ECF subfamily
MELAFLAARAISPEAEDSKLVSGTDAMEAFLREVERRAYRIALVTVRNSDDALDIVQDAMIRLVRRYARRDEQEWRPLFYRILQNCIRDWQRRRMVRTRVVGFLGGPGGDAQGADPLGEVPGPSTDNPLEVLERDIAMQALEDALRALPRRQSEAFMLRNFEGLDVAATATAMGCSQGSVKTHYSRAVSKLRELLGEHI